MTKFKFKVGDWVRPTLDAKPYFAVEKSKVVAVESVGGCHQLLRLHNTWGTFHDTLFEQVTSGRVVVESPFGSKHQDIQDENKKYLDACLADSLKRGEAPYASHKLYPGVLDDNVPAQREQGMSAGFVWGEKADLVAVYIDRGISPGMRKGIEVHKKNGIPVELRSLSLNATWRL